METPAAPKEMEMAAAPKARGEGSQGQVRSEAEHAAPGLSRSGRRPERAAEHTGASVFLPPRWGADPFSTGSQGPRASRSPLATFSPRLQRVVLVHAPSARRANPFLCFFAGLSIEQRRLARRMVSCRGFDTRFGFPGVQAFNE